MNRRMASKEIRRGKHGASMAVCGAVRARTDDDGIMSSEAMTGSNTVERG
jgi:hypothetical protein